MNTDSKSGVLRRIQDRTAAVAVIGLGYVGLPLAGAFARQGFAVLACDIDAEKIAKLKAGES
ncbi:MAG: 3-hydroxyacyl-CoA dehydrogenase NAD-binding domain-containing protein, partial [Rhodospirillaceae bacterium]